MNPSHHTRQQIIVIPFLCSCLLLMMSTFASCPDQAWMKQLSSRLAWDRREQLVEGTFFGDGAWGMGVFRVLPAPTEQLLPEPYFFYMALWCPARCASILAGFLGDGPQQAWARYSQKRAERQLPPYVCLGSRVFQRS